MNIKLLNITKKTMIGIGTNDKKRKNEFITFNQSACCTLAKRFYMWYCYG